MYSVTTCMCFDYGLSLSEMGSLFNRGLAAYSLGWTSGFFFFFFLFFCFVLGSCGLMLALDVNRGSTSGVFLIFLNEEVRPKGSSKFDVAFVLLSFFIGFSFFKILYSFLQVINSYCIRQVKFLA